MIHFRYLWQSIVLLALAAMPCGCADADKAVGATDPQIATQSASADVGSVRVAVDDPAESVADSKAAAATAPNDAPSTVPTIKTYAAGEPSRVGEDWPKFLGPRDNGISGETGLLPKWPEKGPPIVWEKDVGTGYSAPSVLGNRIVLHHRLRDQEIVDCFAADTGKPLWKYAYPTDFTDPYGYNNGPRCSPLLTASRCYTFGAEGKLLCLDLETGQKIWLRDTAADWEIPPAFFGVGSTPVLYGKLLIAMVGGKPESGVVAFDAETGKTVWQSVGKNAWEFPERASGIDAKLASYSSLVIAKMHGHDHLFSLMRDGLVVLNPADGKIRFTYFFRSRLRDSVNAACPVIIGDTVMLSAAYETGAALLKLKPDGSSFDEVWKSENLQTHWSTTIHHQGFLYGFSGRHKEEALLRCLDLKTADVVWETDGLTAANRRAAMDDPDNSSTQPYGRGSAIMAEGKFIVLGEEGVLALVEVNPKEFKEISRIKLRRMKDPSWAAPILSRQRLYLRCEDYMVCLDLKSQSK